MSYNSMLYVTLLSIQYSKYATVVFILFKYFLYKKNLYTFCKKAYILTFIL